MRMHKFNPKLFQLIELFPKQELEVLNKPLPFGERIIDTFQSLFPDERMKPIFNLYQKIQEFDLKSTS